MQMSKASGPSSLLDVRERLEAKTDGPIDFYDDTIKPQWDSEDTDGEKTKAVTDDTVGDLGGPTAAALS